MYRRDPSFTSSIAGPLSFDRILKKVTPLWADVEIGQGKEEVFASPIVAHGLLMVVTRHGSLYFLNQFSGEILSSTSIAGALETQATPLVAGLKLYAAAGNRFCAFRLWNKGRFEPAPEWEFVLDEGVVIRAANTLPDGRLVAVSWGAGKSYLHCLTVAGTDAWSGPLSFNGMLTAPVVDAASSVFMIGEDGHVHHIDAAGTNGKLPPVNHSHHASPRVNTTITPAWFNQTLYFFDLEGFLCTCNTLQSGTLEPKRISNQKLNGVKGFAVHSSGILAAHGMGLTKLSLSGDLAGKSDGMSDSMSGSPVIAGDIGLSTTADKHSLFICDLRGGQMRMERQPLNTDRSRVSPAFADSVVYTCSQHGLISAIKIGAN